ncbi:unnamed protein product [Phytophthora fragariaefolia]|uniref:Unnamed protein product n=1 Tax=Phytophthora fragariaefolia TaxID=1490495 RepID=A0A9W6U0K1_9STRA|nr:unnamed protein product [Phytophthora fragariaefolia]
MDFAFEVGRGFWLLKAQIVIEFIRKFPGEWQDNFGVCLKPSKHAPQCEFQELDEENYETRLSKAWELLDFASRSIRFRFDAFCLYMATIQARMPSDAPIQVPDTATFRQLQNIDRLSQEMQQNHQAEQTNADTNFRLIRIIIQGAVLQAHVNVADLREILGLPSYSIRPPFRDPVEFEIQAPAEDMEDVDHMEEQQDNV